MRLSDDERKEYDSKITEFVTVITQDGEEARSLFPTADKLAREMLDEEPANIRILTAVKGAHLAFNVSELKRAMKVFFKSQERSARRTAVLGVDPKNEREFIAAFMELRGYDMDYHRHFYQGASKTPMRLEDIANDVRLSAGDWDMIKPRGELLSVTELTVALGEWTSQRRQERKQIAADKVAHLSPGRDKAQIDSDFAQVCDWYSPEAPFFNAAFRKYIWSVKRRLIGLQVPQAHMIVIVGPQDTGKTKVAQMLYAPLGELAAEVSLQDVLDTRQMDMPEYFILFTDEMAFVERTEPAQLKTFLTGTSPSRRPMRTNISERIQINATLLATANHSLDKLIYDSSGMRRFVEIKPRPRKEIEPFWDQIVKFDWTGLWQSVDPHSDDPLITPFKDQLMDRQESIRNLDNTEMWLRTFDPQEHAGLRRRETSSYERMEFFAQDLYQVFRDWELNYDPGFRGTSLQRWGREMRSVINNAKVTGWSTAPVGNKTVYRVELAIAPTNQVVPIAQARKFRTSSTIDP